MIDLSKYKLHDLTLPYNEHVDGYTKRIANDLEKDGWNASWLRIYSHSGTHMDAPFHFGVSDQTIEGFSLSSLMGRAWIAHVPVVQPQQLLQIEDLVDVSEKIETGDNLLIRTDWSREIGRLQYRDHLPRIGKKLALWVVDKGINILGVEGPSVADVNNLDEVTEIHEILLGSDVVIAEGLANLDRIERDHVFLIALPLKISGGDGAPARIIAFEEIQ